MDLPENRKVEETGTDKSTRLGSSPALWIAWSIGLLGVVQAARHYLRATTFFLDVVKLLWNVADRDWSNLLEPLQNNQVAAVGFLILEKAAVSVLGVTELASRLIPLLSMVLAVVLFILTAIRVLSPISVVVATTLFAWERLVRSSIMVSSTPSMSWWVRRSCWPHWSFLMTSGNVAVGFSGRSSV